MTIYRKSLFKKVNFNFWRKKSCFILEQDFKRHFLSDPFQSLKTFEAYM